MRHIVNEEVSTGAADIGVHGRSIDVLILGHAIGGAGVAGFVGHIRVGAELVVVAHIRPFHVGNGMVEDHAHRGNVGPGLVAALGFGPGVGFDAVDVVLNRLRGFDHTIGDVLVARVNAQLRVSGTKWVAAISRVGR